MRKTFKWLLPSLLAGLFMAAPSIIARGLQPNQAGSNGKKIKGEHGQQVQAQRRRLKQSRKSTRTEARSSYHSTPPKAGRHPMRKVQRKASPKNPELRNARRQNRSRKKNHPQAPTN